MFTKDNRRNVDIVEGDFVAFKNRVHEVDESIIDRQVVGQVYQPVLIDRRLVDFPRYCAPFYGRTLCFGIYRKNGIGL